MDTECIRLFVLSAEMLNISAAGRQLGMAPAVASGKLAKLEKVLGADLLHRSTRKVALSLEGSEFLPFAKEILDQEDAAFAALGFGSPDVTGTLRFAAPSTFAQLYIMPLLSDFMKEYPGITLDFRLSDTQFDLIEGSFDLAMRNMRIADSSFKGRKLAKDKRVLCASPAYLKQYGNPASPADLAGHRLIAFKELAPKPLISKDGYSAQFDPRLADCRIVVDDGLSQKIATVAGCGISINSVWSIHRELNDGSLVQVLPDYQVDDDIALWLVYPKSNVLTAKVRVFIDFLSDRIGKSQIWNERPT